MSQKHSLQGGCQCGLVRYRISGEPKLRALCHCSMCRRAHAAPAVAWVMFEESQVAFTGQPLKIYHSSPGVGRGFCGNCGTQVSFAADYIPGMIDISTGSLDDPNQLAPQLHYWDRNRLSWLQFSDALPRYPEFPPQD
jgi:hypothetical protein